MAAPQPACSTPVYPNHADDGAPAAGWVSGRFGLSAGDFVGPPRMAEGDPSVAPLGRWEAAPELVRPTEADVVVDEADWEGLEPAFDRVRPYSWTRGRTLCRQELAIEALVSATSRKPQPGASPEHQAVLGLCQTPRSVAELAALLSVPLGVARVVLGDMAEAGSVVVHPTAGSAARPPDLALMQRVLSCLQRL